MGDGAPASDGESAENADVGPQEIETWVTALGRYDNNEFDDALKEFDKISDTSKILFNMGVIHATLGEHEKAVRTVPASTEEERRGDLQLASSRSEGSRSADKR